jgi:O-methyltransferase involved in polyketide biosynthesis
MKQPIALGAVQETMLITLYGRALATRTCGKLLRDPRAIEIVEAIDYNFRRFADEAQVLGAVLRTRILDEMAQAFLASAPGATVVEIGAGLNTRFERIDNGTVRWVDLDLPDAMQLRRRFFTETARRVMVASSVLNTSWTNVVKRSGGPYFMIAEGVFGYFRENEVKKVLALIAERLPGGVIAFDTVGSRSMNAQRGRGVWPGLRARLAWACDDPRQVEQWGLGYRLLESRSLADLPPSLEHALPFSYRYSIAQARILGWDIDAYRMNVYRAEGGLRKHA